MIKHHRVILFIALFCIPASLLYAGGPGNKAPMVEAMMQKYHGFPRAFDDKLCDDVFDDLMANLDPSHMYFTAPDIQQIKKATHIKAGIQGTDPDFLNVLTALYKQRLMWADTVITNALQKPFDFSIKDSIVLSTDKTLYVANDNELKQRWNKLLKYKTLHRLTDLLFYDSTATKEYMLQQQRGQEKIVLKTEERRIKKVLNNPAGYENYMSSLFCNALTQAYDPHSEFFPLTAKENFENELNGGGYSFGIEFNENDKGEVEITHLAPGSPAWKCSQLNQNDVFVQLQWEGDAAVDLAGADGEEISELLGADNHRMLKLTVHKANGMNVTVSLRKEKLQTTDDFVKSYLLNGDNKVGYINLPGFYSEWENTTGSSCAKDVASEVLKLKKENINALILDLRNNGGGSMEEAVELAGIFINEGTLGFAKEQTGRPHAMKDPNRGTIYDGPLLVLVNGLTASAAEFTAAVLQDYNRAIIVGSSTFGKATFQEILPCDTSIDLEKTSPAALNKNKYDYVKLTTGKLYRVTGKSHQLNGVQPDVKLPDWYEALEERESLLKHAAPADTVKRALYFDQLKPLPLADLSAKSGSRVSASYSFGIIQKSSNLFREVRELKTAAIPLSFDPFLVYAKKYNTGSMSLYHQLMQDSTRTFKAENFGAEKARIALGGYDADVNTKTLSGIMHDIYINESFLILADYSKLTK